MEERMATKEALKDIEIRMATKDDIKELRRYIENIEVRIEARMATKEAIKDMATQTDIAQVKTEIAEVKTEIADLKAGITWRMAILGGIIVGVLSAIIKM